MRRTVLALLKIQLPMERVEEMTALEARDYLDAWRDLTEAKKPKKYLVLRKPKSASGKQEATVTEGASTAPKALSAGEIK